MTVDDMPAAGGEDRLEQYDKGSELRERLEPMIYEVALGSRDEQPVTVEVISLVREFIAREVRGEADRRRADRPVPFDVEADVANQRACNTWERVADWIENPDPVAASDG